MTSNNETDQRFRTEQTPFSQILQRTDARRILQRQMVSKILLDTATLIPSKVITTSFTLCHASKSDTPQRLLRYSSSSSISMGAFVNLRIHCFSFHTRTVSFCNWPLSSNHIEIQCQILQQTQQIMCICVFFSCKLNVSKWVIINL